MASHLITRDERLAVIENILFHSPEGVRVVDLADACDVDRRTIYRDMTKLRTDGVPIYQKSGRFYVSREYYLASVQLNVHEMTALFVSVRVLAQLAERQNPHAISALSKLSTSLPESLSEHVEVVTEMLREKPADRLFVSVIETLTRAWSERRQVRLWYSGEVQPIDFAPYFIESTAFGVYYAVGLDAGAERLRALRLSSVLRVEILASTFQPDVQFHPDGFLSDDAGIVLDGVQRDIEVMLAFSPEIADQVLSQRLHTLVKAEQRDDGRLYVSMAVDRWENLVPWVRSLGSQVEVLEPAVMRELFRQEAIKGAALYGVSKDDV